MSDASHLLGDIIAACLYMYVYIYIYTSKPRCCRREGGWHYNHERTIPRLHSPVGGDVGAIISHPQWQHTMHRSILLQVKLQHAYGITSEPRCDIIASELYVAIESQADYVAIGSQVVLYCDRIANELCCDRIAMNYVAVESQVTSH